MSNATIKDVAAAAGVSIKTVSRVINREPNVRPDKQEQVRAAVAKLNYKPSASARSLRSKKSYLVGLLYDNPTPTYVLRVQEGALAGCGEEDFNLLIRPCQFSSSTFVEDVIRFIDHSKIDGLILTPPLTDHGELIEALSDADVPFVRISPISNDGSLCVVSNEFDAAMLATQHLISLGHREIGFIIGHLDHGASIWRFDGYKAALKDAGIKVSKGLIQQGDFSFESGEKCARRLLNKEQRPTAIFASNDAMAAATYKVAHQLNIAVPYSLSIAGFDDSPIASQLWPPMTTVRQPTYRLANQATKLLINRIRQSNSDVDLTPLKCELVIRQSTGPAKH